MQLNSIFVLILLFFSFHEYIRAVPVQPTKSSLSDNNNSSRRSGLSSGSKTCSYSSDCPSHSQCVSGVCECVKGWTTWKDGVPCSYEQKSKLTAFILSFLLGNFGADWFYLSQGDAGYIVVGIVKLLMVCGCCSSIFQACSKRNGESSTFFACISILVSCGGGIWWLVDWIRILVDGFSDGNGAPLYGW